MIFDMICVIFDAVILTIYLHKILGARKESVSAALYAGCVCLVEIFLIFLMRYFGDQHNSFRTFVSNLASFATTFLLTILHRSNLRHRLFVSVSFHVYASMSELIVYSIFSLLPTSMAEILFSNNSYGLLMSKIVLFILLNITILLWNRKRQHYTLQYSVLVLMMPLLSFLLLLTMTHQLTWNSGTVYDILHLVGMSGILAANVLNYFLLDNVMKVTELEQEKIQMDKQFEYQTEKYQQISTVYRNSGRFIHDAKKHFFFIQNCMVEENYDSVIPYLQETVKDIENTHNHINTGNLVIDAFVSNHQSLAEQENIEFFTDIQINNENVVIADYDFSIILGNLLDNSLNACRKILSPAPRQIAVEIFTTNMELVVHISNTIPAPKIREAEDSPHLAHGFGMKNIEVIVAKYLGTYTHYLEDERYHSIVAIPCPIQVTAY